MSFIARLTTFGLISIFCLWLTGVFAFSLMSMNSSLPKIDTVDALVVLTGGKQRVEQGLDLFAQGVSTNLFISGVHPSTSLKDIKKRWDGDPADLPSCCLTLGTKATTTIENAYETKTWIEDNNIERLVLITSAYHMPRARLEFNAILPESTLIIPYAVPYETSDFEHASTWRLIFSEYHKTLFRWVQLRLFGTS